uniref:Transmembrane protein 198 n=1 Tax=Strombidium inclinatum TaxID=197538 RepID=A0A7S3ISL7_9SPIT|mmetsp:Transcript_35590/g.54407  ORF Transcript_35590/g.54407 Transcript_35590/m.54407 type:complete len:224 (+) Transcript_35590:637-1308(+)
MENLNNIIGVILIVIGLAFTFVGAKFLIIGFSALVFLLSGGIAFLLFYNLLPLSSPNVAQVVSFLAAIAIGFGSAWCSYKFAQDWAVPLLAAWGGIVTALILANLLHVTSSTVELILVIVGAGVFGYLGKKMNRFIRCLGTAFVGSFLLMRGIACYAGGYPSEASQFDPEDIKENAATLAYMVGLIVTTVVGTLVQLYIFRDENKDDDDFMAQQDEGRTCGCF